MKKALITTFTGEYSLNYGSLFQTTALQSLLRQHGYNPVTCNGFPTPFHRGGDSKRLPFYLLKGKGYIKTRWKFNKWIKEYVDLYKYYRFDKVVKYASKFDILISGSDSIWLDSFYSPLFFWNDVNLKWKKKISFAPSLCRIKDNNSSENSFLELLKDYSHISVREASSVEFLRSLGIDKAKTVLDPTLCVSEDYWENKACDRLIKDKYILCYFINNIEKHNIACNMIKRKVDAQRIVYINTDWIDKGSGRTYADYFNNEYKGITGPSEFLSLVKNAEAICTNSFHGCCLSIAFRKQFFFFDRKKNNSLIIKDLRISDLFERLGTGDRNVYRNDIIDKMEEIDYSVVERRLLREREMSNAFLHEALK